jgi:hypothetical protein
VVTLAKAPASVGRRPKDGPGAEDKTPRPGNLRPSPTRVRLGG